MLFWMRRFWLYSCQSLEREGGECPFLAPTALVWWRLYYIVAATLVFYFMIIRVILLSTHTVNILLPVTSELYFFYFVSNQQNDFIMILCGAGDKPISNWKSIKNILTESIFKSFCVYLCQFMYYVLCE